MAHLTFFTFFILVFLTLQEIISAKDVVVELSASYLELSPDGVKKQVLVVNGQFPGPTIYASLGDTLIVRVRNRIQSPDDGETYSTSVHWHGLEMMYNPWFDGPEGVTQCPIPFGESMEYRFKLYQAGTYWYHSHHMWQYVEGFWGILIIANDPGELYKYDGDISFALMDWYHAPSKDLSAIFHADDTKNPVPDSGLINGKGYYPCDNLTKPYTCDESKTHESPDVYSVVRGKTYRIRVINTSARARFIFSIDGHKLRAIEVDGVDTVEVSPVDTVEIWPAQRYSFLVTMNAKGQADSGKYWIRAETVQPFDNDLNKVIPLARAILQYEDSEFCNVTTETVSVSRNTPLESSVEQRNVNAAQGRPARHNVDWTQLMKNKDGAAKSKILEGSASKTSFEYVFDDVESSANAFQEIVIQSVSMTTKEKWPMTQPAKNPVRLDPNKCRPRESRGASVAPDYYDQLIVLNATFNEPTSIPGENHAMINGIRYSSENSPPVIFRVMKNIPIDETSIPQNTTLLRRVIQVVINNKDFEGHPWHLHGHTFWVMGTGVEGTAENPNYYDEVKHKDLLSISGVRRDTTETHPYSWAVIRYETDNPGTWLFHCHINWHLEVGLGAVFVEGPEELRELFTIPPEAKRICALNGISV